MADQEWVSLAAWGKPASTVNSRLMLTASPKEMVRPRKVYGFILNFFLIVATMLAVECNFSKAHIFWGTFTYMPLFNDVFSLIPGTFLRSQILRIFFIV